MLSRREAYRNVKLEETIDQIVEDKTNSCLSGCENSELLIYSFKKSPEVSTTLGRF
jgi:hypothetical protein